MRLYGKCWLSSDFFKVAKLYLRLSRELQCRSYDAMVVLTTFARIHIMFSLRILEEQDVKTSYQLFLLCSDELEDIGFAEVIFLVIYCLKASLMEGAGLIWINGPISSGHTFR